MRAGVWAAVLAASIAATGTAGAACLPGQAHNCVNLELAPQASQDIVAGEHLATPARKTPGVEAIPTYTGPTIGLNRKVRQAPEIGYKWAIN